MIALLCLLLFLSIAGIYGFLSEGKASSDVLDYVTGDFDTRVGLDFLKEYFNVAGDAMFSVAGANQDLELAEHIDNITQIGGVEQLIWYNTLDAFDSIGLLLSLFTDITIDTSEFKSFLKQPIDDSNSIYLVLILHEYSPSSSEAFELLKSIELELSPRVVSFAGMTATAVNVMNDTLNELPMYMLIAALAVLLVFTLSSRSLTETLVLLVVIFVSVALNIGVNYLLPEVSVVGVATSALFQLGISLSFFSIILNYYREKRIISKTPFDAIKLTIADKWPAIFASCTISTVAVFALSFMSISIGFEIAFSLVRGLLTSAFVTLILSPSLLILLDKLTTKTQFKHPIKLKPPATKFSFKISLAILTITAIIGALSFIGQKRMHFSYFKMYENTTQLSHEGMGAAQLSNQLIVAMPVIPKTNLSHANYISEIKQVDGVEHVLGAFSAIDIDPSLLIKLIPIMPDNIMKFFSNVDGVWYTMTTVVLDGDVNNPNFINTYAKINEITNKYFNQAYKFGVLSGVYDMSTITTYDFNLISLIVFIFIALSLTVIFKSPLKGLLISLILQISIYSSLSLYTLLFKNINFLVYLLSTVIHIPVFLSQTLTIFAGYNKNVNNKIKNSIKFTSQNAFRDVWRSALAFASGCIGVEIFANNLIVKNLTALLALGSLTIALLITLTMPTILVILNKPATLADLKEPDDSDPYLLEGTEYADLIDE
ncbi:MAG: MMPL family transporter [Christensenellaceae bacterium]|jgi:predicted RND superfamily exporter protein|nr:MMPL family transporter [Christensenellaceae bacterium]